MSFQPPTELQQEPTRVVDHVAKWPCIRQTDRHEVLSSYNFFQEKKKNKQMKIPQNPEKQRSEEEESCSVTVNEHSKN